MRSYRRCFRALGLTQRRRSRRFEVAVSWLSGVCWLLDWCGSDPVLARRWPEHRLSEPKFIKVPHFCRNLASGDFARDKWNRLSAFSFPVRPCKGCGMVGCKWVIIGWTCSKSCILLRLWQRGPLSKTATFRRDHWKHIREPRLWASSPSCPKESVKLTLCARIAAVFAASHSIAPSMLCNSLYPSMLSSAAEFQIHTGFLWGNYISPCRRYPKRSTSRSSPESGWALWRFQYRCSHATWKRRCSSGVWWPS